MQTISLTSNGIYQFNDAALLPLHEASKFYGGSNLKVITDEITWHKVTTNRGVFAIHDSDINESVAVSFARNERGEDIRVLPSYMSLIKGKNRNGEIIRFTSVEAAKASKFKFSLYLGEFSETEFQDYYGSTSLLDYHDARARDSRIEGNVPSFHNEGDEYLVGLEVEKVQYELQQKGLAFKILEETGWKKERDGSLNSGGFEMVSPKLPLLDLARIKAACQPVAEYINSQSDSSCGGHINLSRKNVTSKELLTNAKGFIPILYSLYENRLNNHYCQAKNWKLYFSSIEKYSACYLKNSEVLELRIFSRVRNYETLEWRVRLLQQLLGDYGNNLNQYLLKLSNKDSALYKLFAEQYSHEKIGKKITLAAALSVRYGCGKVSISIAKKINERWGSTIIPY